MNRRRSAVALAGALAVLFSASSAHAVIINTSSAGLFQFDASGVLYPAGVTAPFDAVRLSFTFPSSSSPETESLGFGDELKFSVYDELSNPAIFSQSLASSVTSTIPFTITFTVSNLNPDFPDFNGFIFVEAEAGSFNVLGLTVALGGGDLLNPSLGAPVVAEFIGTQLPGRGAIPEPATLSLLGGGLAALWIARRKKRV